MQGAIALSVLLLVCSGQQVGNFRPDSCPRLTCGDLNSAHNIMTPNLPWVCAKGQDPQTIILDQCPENLYCVSPLSLYVKWNTKQYFAFEVYCNTTLSESPYQTYNETTFPQLMSTACALDICQDRLAIGLHPKQCITDADCLQLSGATTTCTCGSDGNRYCALNDGDFILNDLQTAACNGYSERFLYYQLFGDYYPLLQNPPNCLGDVFHNIGLMEDLQAGLGYNQTYVLANSTNTLLTTSGGEWVVVSIMLTLALS